MIIIKPEIALLLLFNSVIRSLSSSTGHASEKYSHPLCNANFNADPVFPVAKSVTDVTQLFDGIGLPDGACVFNPAVVHVAGRIYCLFARVYQATEPLRRCKPGYLDRSPFLDGWRGRSTNILAVLRLRKRSDSRQLHAKLLGYSYLGQSNHEDGRLFKDMHGRVFVYMALPLGTSPERAVVNTVSRVLIRCIYALNNCSVSLGHPRLLSYFGSESVMDKNWVPWNGTAFMSYSRYGTLGPHSIFNWGSYDEPTFHTGFDAVAEDSVFPRFAAYYGKLMHLSGGSPAILEEGGQSFLAIGHLKAHPGCFHPEVTPAWANMSSPNLLPGVQNRCAHLAQSSNASQKAEELREAFSFGDAASIGVHYPLDYAFFFYRFSASAPYNMTHISYGFIPYIGGRAADHTGIVFPIGLERFGKSDYIITYGDSDQASKILLMSSVHVNAMLWHLSKIAERLDEYVVCALPCHGVPDCMQ
ncbi:hypothetical protein Vretimale_16458 [Volvox reticuliferus]|uniref:Uncharacterized protein n=1 Tax=Volvox reticuliferus TaxID=1737510 RepID=A0A8J4LWT3_9CHLO|nr:hypothetical protein Vretifemale_8635 [Volvox reticuliferus]GIM13336.1 hypothetical protein Vretimale_16458 [Volvox reticuliferus]